MNFIGQLFFFLAYFTPLITIPIAWKMMDGNKIFRVFIGLILAAILSYLFIFISISILIRNGLGPGWND